MARSLRARDTHIARSPRARDKAIARSQRARKGGEHMCFCSIQQILFSLQKSEI